MSIKDAKYYEDKIASLGNELAQKVIKPYTQRRIFKQLYKLDNERTRVLTDKLLNLINMLKQQLGKHVCEIIKQSELEHLFNENITQVIIEIMPDNTIPPQVFISMSKSKYL